MLSRSHAYQSGSGSFTNHNYYHADGGGNITYLVNSSQSVVASYQYDSFGNTISSSGTLASANVYRFSSKEQMPNTGLYYYGYRFYDPNLQRWLNRDPLAGYPRWIKYGRHGRMLPFDAFEGPNLYWFVNNCPNLYVDINGLWTFRPGQFLKGVSYGLLGFAGALAAMATAEVPPLAGVLAVGAAGGVSYGVGNMVAAFSDDDEDARAMIKCPKSVPEMVTAAVIGEDYDKDNASGKVADAAFTIINSGGSIESIPPMLELISGPLPLGDDYLLTPWPSGEWP